MVSRARGALNNFLDLAATNARLNCTRLIDTSQLPLLKPHRTVRRALERLRQDPWLPQSYRAARDAFIPSLVLAPYVLISQQRYYSVHFRCEADWLIRDASSELYSQWLTHTMDRPDTARARDILSAVMAMPRTQATVSELLRDYEVAILKYFTDRSVPILFASGLGKPTVDTYQMDSGRVSTLDWILDQLQSKLSQSFQFLKQPAHTVLREVNAAHDLVHVVHSIGFIGCPKSSFTRVAIRLLREKGISSHGVTTEACFDKDY
jgi:hypothetical protein